MPKKQFNLNLGSQKLNLQTGLLAPQANCAVLATYGKTIILAAVTLGRPDPAKDYFPLSVEFIDKLYAGGIIKSSRWLKREGGLVDSSILAGRLIDRAIRPLFPEGFNSEVQILVTVLSNDKNTDLIIPSFFAVSTALSLSDIPFNGPVSAVRVSSEAEKLIVNPDLKTLNQGALNLLVCVGPQGVNMIEASANIVDNKTLLSAIKKGQDFGQKINQEISAFVKTAGLKKIDYIPALPSDGLIQEVEALIKKEVEDFFENGADDGKHILAENTIVDKVLSLPDYQEKIEKEEISVFLLREAVHAVIKHHLRTRTLKGLRFDGRKFDEIRPLSAQVAVLPCTHGSAFFQRGLTQALTITTLSSLRDCQTLEDSNGESTKRYLHFYSAPPFSTGQTDRIGRPGRREVGHGALAEKALEPVIPSVEEFPYTILLNSEILSQNGSSSMASTCGSTLSLLDAGVPLKDKVAGISVGMVSADKKYQLLTDIAGIEDFCGDMDFKIAGTRNGITAIQLDVKCQGLNFVQIEEVFAVSTKARLKILDLIDKTLPSPRPKLSEFAPKIVMVKINPDKIGEVVGSGGKTIKALMEQYQVQIDIDDDGQVSISSLDKKFLDQAAFHVKSMVRKVEIGEEFDGVVTRVEDYGVFVEFLPGREALVHVSELSGAFLQNISQIIKIGDKLHVAVIGFNENHQIKLSAPKFKAAHPGSASTGRDRQPVFDRQPRFNKFNPNLPSRRRPSSRSGGNRVSR